MFGRKSYTKPDFEKLALDDNTLERVTGGIGDKGKGKTNAAPDTTVAAVDITSVTDSSVAGLQVIDGSAGNADVGRGRGRGGGCDGVPYHRNARTFSSGRNSGC